jgi:hypothetical protein
MNPVANFRFNVLAVLEKIADSLEDDTQNQRSTSDITKKPVRLDYSNIIKYVYVAQSLTTPEYN